MTKRILIVLMVLGWTLTGSDFAQADEAEMKAQLEQALQEIKALRTEVEDLKQKTSSGYDKALEEAITKIPASKSESETGTFKIPAGWSFQPYGYLKFDMSYDDSSVVGDNGNYVVFVRPENDTTRGDDKFSFTARQTRLGAKIFAPNIGEAKVMGLVEIDFYNPEIAVTNENKATPMLRHAYGQVTGSDWSLLFGQTADIISPLVPDTLNYSVGWFGGNVGYRHPQLQAAKWWDCPEGNQLKVEAALSRDINSDKGLGTGIDDGQDASSPSVLGRVSYSTPMAGQKLTAGLSGHFGKEEIDWDYVGDDDEVHTWSLNADLLVPICDKVDVKGEFFWAENMDSYFGGIGQGVNNTTQGEIEALGGWAQIGYKPCEKWAFNTGAGFDDPKDADLNTADRSMNYFVFTNANYNFTSYLSTGVEFTYWRTDYKDSDDGDDFRVQHSWILKF
jgi:hypothetical protein